MELTEEFEYHGSPVEVSVRFENSEVPPCMSNEELYAELIELAFRLGIWNSSEEAESDAR